MKVKLIKKKADNWSNLKFYKNCKHQIGTYFTRTGKRYTGLEKEDQERIELALSYEPGYLNANSSFWDNFAVTLGSNQEEVILNTEDPFDEFRYKFLKGHKRVANGYNDRKPGTDYILIEEQATAEEINKKAQVKIKATIEYQKMSIEDMRKALRLYGFKTDTLSREVIESTLYQLLEEDPDRFNTIWTNNKDKEIHFLLEEAVAQNIIRKSKTTYKYGTDPLGFTLEDAIDYLKNPANNDIRVSIQSQLDAKVEIINPKSISTKKSEITKLKEEILSESDE
jgi:hypothetical protein